MTHYPQGGNHAQVSQQLVLKITGDQVVCTTSPLSPRLFCRTEYVDQRYKYFCLSVLHQVGIHTTYWHIWPRPSVKCLQYDKLRTKQTDSITNCLLPETVDDQVVDYLLDAENTLLACTLPP